MPGRADKDATVERARERAARLLGVDAADVALLSSTTEGVNVLALALDWQPGDTVVVEAIEFPSLVFPWAKLKEQGVEIRIVRPSDGSQWNYTLDDLAAAVDSRTRLLATSQVSYLTGRRHDLAQLRDIADRAGALLLVDATHGAGVVPVEAGLADVVVSSCYKWLLGTQGIALFYRDPQRLGGLEPPIVGWHSRAGPSEPHRPSHHPCGGGGPLDALSLEQPDVWTAPDHAGRFEAANVSYLSAYLLESALAYLSRFPAAQLAAHSVQLTGLVLAGFARLGLEVTTPQQPEQRAGNATCVVPARHQPPVRWPPGSRRKACWCGAVTAACVYRVTCTTMKRMSSACWRSCPPPSRRPDHHEHWSFPRKQESTSPCGAGGP